MRQCPRCRTSYSDEETVHCPADGTPLLPPDELGKHAGVTLDARYFLEQRIGAGGLGEVYRARHLKMGKSFAVKLLHPQIVTDPQFLGRFDREARALSRLRHPCCVEVTDYGRSEELGPYIVMELLAGEQLSRYTRAPGEGLPLSQVLELISDVLSALEHAHEQGIIHRDLKPDNIVLVPHQLLPGKLIPKILDFGVAKIRRAAAKTSSSPPQDPELTAAGLVLGTPAYMAPEQLIGDQREVDARADLYAVGAILYELCCGERPFGACSDAMEMLQAHLTRKPASPADMRPSLPAELVAIIDRALQNRRGDRFDSAAAFRQALAELPPLPQALANERPPAAAAAAATADPVSTGGLRPDSIKTVPSELAAALPGSTDPPRQVKVTAPTAALPLSGAGHQLWATAPASSFRAAGSEPAGKRSRTLLIIGGAFGGLLVIGLGLALALWPRRDDVTAALPVDSRARAVAPQPQPELDRRAPSTRSGEPVSAKWSPPPPLLKAAQQWRRRGSRQRGARQLMAYLRKHRGDAQAHLYVARLYLQAFWGSDGLKLVRRALKADPKLKLDPATLVSLCFAYQGGTHWLARQIVSRHGADHASRALIVGAAAIRDQGTQRNLLAHVQRLGGQQTDLDRRLLALATASSCKQRRRAFAALDPSAASDPFVEILLQLLRADHCIGAAARSILARR